MSLIVHLIISRYLSAVYHYLVAADEIPVYLIYLYYPERTTSIQADVVSANVTMELQTAPGSDTHRIVTRIIN